MEACPHCGKVSEVRTKLVLVDAAWVPSPGVDSRLAHIASLRADDLKSEHKRDGPLEQFVDGFYCESCDKGFISDESIKDNHRYYCR